MDIFELLPNLNSYANAMCTTIFSPHIGGTKQKRSPTETQKNVNITLFICVNCCCTNTFLKKCAPLRAGFTRTTVNLRALLRESARITRIFHAHLSAHPLDLTAAPSLLFPRCRPTDNSHLNMQMTVQPFIVDVKQSSRTHPVMSCRENLTLLIYLVAS